MSAAPRHAAGADDSEVRLAIAVAELDEWKARTARVEALLLQQEQRRLEAAEALTEKERRLAVSLFELEDRNRRIEAYREIASKYEDLRVSSLETRLELGHKLETATRELAARTPAASLAASGEIEDLRSKLARLEAELLEKNAKLDAIAARSNEARLEAAERVREQEDRLHAAASESEALRERIAHFEALLAKHNGPPPSFGADDPASELRVQEMARELAQARRKLADAEASQRESHASVSERQPATVVATGPTDAPVPSQSVVEPPAAAKPAATVPRVKIGLARMTRALIPQRLRQRLALREGRRALADNPLFDAEWYLKRYGDVARAGLDPRTHYIRHGGFEGRDPGPEFSSSWYLASYPDVRRSGLNPLVHFIKYGRDEGRLPLAPAKSAAAAVTNPSRTPDTAGTVARREAEVLLLETSALFDKEWYAATYGDEPGDDPVRHYLTEGTVKGRNPGPGFDTAWYLSKYGDVRRAGMNPLVHYINYGQKEGRLPLPLGAEDAARSGGTLSRAPRMERSSAHRPEDVALLEASPLFDKNWYLASYADVPEGDPVRHYLSEGAADRRNPGPGFNTAWYLGKYGDVRRAGMNPLVHYITYGQKEGRLPRAPVEPPSDKPFQFFSEPLPSDAAAPAASESPAENGLTVLVMSDGEPDRVAACLDRIGGQADLQSKIVLATQGEFPIELERALGRHPGVRRMQAGASSSITDRVNEGLEAAGKDDVVLIAPGTLVAPDEVGRLRSAAYSGDRVATATPLSAYQGPYRSAFLDALSEAERQSANGRLADEHPAYPKIPVGTSACLFLRRDALDDTGAFDAEAFPQIDDAVHDFCLRAGRLGWVHALDDATIVQATTGKASIGASLAERYPEFIGALAAFSGSQARTTLAERLRRALPR